MATPTTCRCRSPRSSRSGKDAYRRKFGDEASQKDLSPVTHVAKGKDIPPFLILHVADHPETKAQSQRLAKALQEAGVLGEGLSRRGQEPRHDQRRPGHARRQADEGAVRLRPGLPADGTALDPSRQPPLLPQPGDRQGGLPDRIAHLEQPPGHGAERTRPGSFDFDGYLDFLVKHHHNFIRLWRWESTTGLRAATRRKPGASSSPRIPGSAPVLGWRSTASPSST